MHFTFNVELTNLNHLSSIKPIRKQIALIAIEHIYIMYKEMFAWDTLGRKTFKGAMPDELFTPTKAMAANQGLYNGFLAAGLI